MASHEETIDIGRPPAVVFDLLHDYRRRLTWDRFLRRAEIVSGESDAGLGVVTRCQARRLAGGLSMETIYVAFDRPHVAAVRLTRGPRLFSSFAASLRQTPIAGGTRVAYKYTLRTRPRWLAWLVEPVVSRVFARETRRRLAALKSLLEATER